MLKARKTLAVLLAVALVFALGALVGCGEKKESTSEKSESAEFTTVEEGKLIAGSDLDYPPFESVNGETPEGFDVDIVNAIGDELGLEVVFKKEIFDTLIPTLKAGGKFDITASAMTINDERLKEIDFSDAYFDSNQSITMKTGSTYAKPEDLKGKKVSVQAGTSGEDWANENLKPAGATVVPFKGTTEAISALEAGNVDAMVIDLPVAADLVKDATRGFAVVAQVPTGEQYGFGVSKDNPELKAAINDALAKIRDNGTYDEIYTKWFGDVPR